MLLSFLSIEFIFVLDGICVKIVLVYNFVKMLKNLCWKKYRKSVLVKKYFFYKMEKLF